MIFQDVFELNVEPMIFQDIFTLNVEPMIFQDIFTLNVEPMIFQDIFKLNVCINDFSLNFQLTAKNDDRNVCTILNLPRNKNVLLCVHRRCFYNHLISKLKSKTVPVLPSVGPSLIFPFHLLPFPVHHTRFSFCFFPGFFKIFILLSSNKKITLHLAR